MGTRTLDRQGTPARSASKTSLAKVTATCVQDVLFVHSRCSGLRNAADYRKANGWICTACVTPPPPSPAHTPTMSDRSFNILQWNANGIGNTVSHDTLISRIVGSSLPPAITRWLSCYLRGRQAATSFRGTKSSTRIIHTGVPQGSKLSHSLFN